MARKRDLSPIQVGELWTFCYAKEVGKRHPGADNPKLSTGQSEERTRMLELLFEVVISNGLQAIGWAVLKVVTLGRHRGFQPEDVILEGTVGFAAVAVVGYGAYRWFFQG